ncbi:hypothetical protein EMIT079MI2_620002 [Bacillus sp. IT-79MI2]
MFVNVFLKISFNKLIRPQSSYKKVNVNFLLFVYIHFPLNIDFIATYPFSSKTTRKVYIQIKAKPLVQSLFSHNS